MDIVRKSRELQHPESRMFTPEEDMAMADDEEPPKIVHRLDRAVGMDTVALYQNMRDKEHKHRPPYSPSAPYVRYRRYAFPPLFLNLIYS